MIILKHLAVEHFRIVRELSIHFPQRGSILIQGSNEAGKSALLESICFALYGEPLALDQRMRSLDDLILYGTDEATVQLVLAVGVTELTITRRIERGKGQHVTLQVRKLGMPEEQSVTDLAAANERIIAELGNMDSETLRNSCLIEQKGLTRLEELDGRRREATLRNLLGLEKLARLTGQFRLVPQDEQRFTESIERLKLAEIQVRIPDVSRKLDELEASLDAVSLLEDLAEISRQEADITEQHDALDQLHKKRSTLRAKQNRVQLLRKADATLGDIIEAYDALAVARHELPEIERQLAELDKREREELPLLEKRVSQLADLTRSFGTLERMSNDLLRAGTTIKDLEQELKQQETFQDDADALNEQITRARGQVDQARRAQNELEEQRRTGRPKLEERLQRLHGLADKLNALHQAEEQYAGRVMSQGLADENATRIRKVQQDIRDTEQELALVEKEALQAQEYVDELEKQRQLLNLRYQLEEWRRLKGLSQGLTQAEQQVMVAHQHQARLTQAAMDAQRTTHKCLGLVVGAVAFSILMGGGAIATALSGAGTLFGEQGIIAAALGIIALLSLAAAGWSYQNFGKARKDEEIATWQMQEATNQVGMMVAAREAAIRRGGNHEALAQIEYEIQSRGVTVPRSVDEADVQIQQMHDSGINSEELQQQMSEKQERVVAAQTQVNITTEALTSLRKDLSSLKQQREDEGWDNIIARLRADRIAIEDRQHEIASRAGQEGLPIPTFGSASSPSSVVPDSASTEFELEIRIEDTIQATERELTSLESKSDLLFQLEKEVMFHQDALDVLLDRQKTLSEQHTYVQQHNPQQELERARERQATLRSALQSLQDSLRQRVQPLHVAFGQAAIGTAETAARRQLEALHIALGNRVELQSRRATHSKTLTERQDALSEYYHQLAKYSSSLGSWIVPPNPFADALMALRTRCQHEIEAANESVIAKDLETLDQQEGASSVKIALCLQEIEELHERITEMLESRKRPKARGYTFGSIAAVWPLVEKLMVRDRSHLEEQHETLEQELEQLERQATELSTHLHIVSQRLDLDEAKASKEQYERIYETHKRGGTLLKAVNDRLMQKMLPHTQYYMQQILPLLTSGRYHDIHVRAHEEEGTASGGPFQLFVWDTAAREYVPKSALSGGAADQVSFALRLAFAIAALPRELNAAPGFMLLDEPLSSFDHGRTQALVDVVTGELLGEHFEQILFVSHSNAFDSGMFPYHIYMESGSIVESNLPRPQPAASNSQTTPVPENEDDGEEGVEATFMAQKGRRA